MKKIILFTTVCLVSSVFQLQAQNIGINATGAAPDAGAMLDVSSANKGLLIPRVNITNLATIAPITGSATVSMLVYNTNATTGLGYHYWDGATWVRLSSGDAWQITGNNNTTFGTHFLGTTNAQGVDFRTNNIIRLRIPNANQIHANADGTALLPFYSWANDPNTGMYSIGADILGFSSVGLERLRLSTTSVVFNELSYDYDFRIESNNQVNMFFVDGGNDRIGIGLNNPAYRLEMKMNEGTNYIAAFENTNANSASLMGYKNVGGFNALGGVTNIATGLGSYGVSLQATGGSTAIWGTSNSSDAFGVYGSIPTTGSWLGFGGVFTGGLGYLNGLYNLSDNRVKTNIKTITNAIEKIKNIQGISYNYNLEEYNYLVRGDNKTYLGFIAQNIEDIFPEAVTKKELIVDGPMTATASADMSKYKRETFTVVDYTAIIPVTVQAIKEQQTIIESQNAKIEALEKMVLELQKAIENK